MKHLRVLPLPVSPAATVHEVSDALDGIAKNDIGIMPWPDYSYHPSVSFAIAYDKDHVFLKYYVSENFVRATYSQPNDPVYKDSCVEIFLSFGTERQYYNFEFNCAGTCLLGFGKERNNRQLADDQVIKTIRYQTALKPAGDVNAKIGWELTVIIPVEAFHSHVIDTLKGKHFRVNFYKCGDDLPEPCYLSWNGIDTPAPDFHVPECFGSMEFC